MNIYFVEYSYMCGNYRAVIIAKNKDQAATMFGEYFSDAGEARVKKIGKSHLKKARVVVSENNY
jgi:hypothetical protein